MAGIYVMDEYSKDRLMEKIDEAKTVEDVKKVLKDLLNELPVEHQ